MWQIPIQELRQNLSCCPYIWNHGRYKKESFFYISQPVQFWNGNEYLNQQGKSMYKQCSSENHELRVMIEVF